MKDVSEVFNYRLEEEAEGQKVESAQLALEITACFEVGFRGNRGVCGALWPHVLWGCGVGGGALESWAPPGPEKRLAETRCGFRWSLSDELLK